MPRHILITGFQERVGFTGDLDITVFGVINPNRFNNDPTGRFMFGILDGYRVIIGNDLIPGIIPQLAPEGM